MASVIVIGSLAQFKIFIDTPGLDSTPTERPVDQSPTGFTKQGPRPEDRRHPQKFQRRRKRKQYDRGIQKAHGSCNNWQCSSEDTHSKPREGERDKPKTPTQSPGKEKEKETGSRCNKTIGSGRYSHTPHPSRRYNSPSLLQHPDWLSQCSTGSVGAGFVTNFVMDTGLEKMVGSGTT
ncbi:hypothetical protein BU17DRAFT_70622 [Hysterangium stoloniferum]|nr:hypothetical protein BU17DRAFT_70622 [Hysterangium stoloniferum]